MRNVMLAKFRAMGSNGPVVLRMLNSKQTFRCVPSIDKAGELYVSLYLGRSKRQYHSLPLDIWAGWASAHTELAR